MRSARANITTGTPCLCTRDIGEGKGKKGSGQDARTHARPPARTHARTYARTRALAAPVYREGGKWRKRELLLLLLLLWEARAPSTPREWRRAGEEKPDTNRENKQNNKYVFIIRSESTRGLFFYRIHPSPEEGN